MKNHMTQEETYDMSSLRSAIDISTLTQNFLVSVCTFWYLYSYERVLYIITVIIVCEANSDKV